MGIKDSALKISGSVLKKMVENLHLQKMETLIILR